MSGSRLCARRATTVGQEISRRRRLQRDAYRLEGSKVAGVRGSFRSGSNIGSSWRNAGVSGRFAANADFSVFP
jgi:hypothetical protein